MIDIVERVRAMVVEAIMEDLAVMVDRMLEGALTPELEVIARQLVTRELQRLRVAMGGADPVFPEFRPEMHVVEDDHDVGGDAEDVDDDEELGADEDDECELEPTHSERSLKTSQRAKLAQARRFIERRGRVGPKELRAHITVSNLTWGKIRPFLEVTDRVRVERSGNVITYVWEGRR